MRVGIDIRELEKGTVTGIGRYLLNFLKFAVKNKREWEFILFGNQKTQNCGMDSPNSKMVLITEYSTFWWDQVQLPGLLKKERIDIFLTPYYKAPVFTSRKILMIISDLIPLLADEYKTFGRFLRRLYFKNLARLVVKKAYRIVTVSLSSKKDIIKIFGIPADRIEVIKLGVGETYRPMRVNFEELASKYGITKKFIFYCGNFNPHKNVPALIEAYNRLPADTKRKYQLVLAGRKDKNYPVLKRMAERLKLNENLVFLDFVPEDDLPALYSAGSLFVFPSLYEGFGLPPLEAMACGTPVVASNAASIPEVVGDAGILVDFKDIEEVSRSINEVITNTELRKELVMKGLRRSKDFSVGEMASKILAIMEEMAKHRILIIIPGGIGNVICFTPALKALRRRFQESIIVFMTAEPGVEGVLGDSALIDEVIMYDRRKSFHEKYQFIRRLREKSFDLAIVATGTNAFKGSLLTYLARIPYRVGENIKGLGLWYTTKIDYRDGIYEIDGNINLIKAMGIKPVDDRPFIFISENDERFAKEFLLKHGLSGDLIIGMHIGPAAQGKGFRRWPEEKFLELADRLTATYRAKIILFGGRDEIGLTDKIANLMVEAPAVAAGKTSLGETAALIKKCRLFIASDSGPMHIAGAIGTPVVAIFGPTDPKKTHSRGGAFTIVRQNLKCSPCYKRGKVDCDTADCLNLVTVEEVLKAVDGQLSKQKVI